MLVPVRQGRHAIALKRFEAIGRGPSNGNQPPAVLLIHDGPGLPSRYLDPLAARLCRPAGRQCFVYDQLGCGRSRLPPETLPEGGYGLSQSLEDLEDLLRHMKRLGISNLHLVGHGFGGVLMVELLLQGRLLKAGDSVPRVCSVALVGTPSSTAAAEEEAVRLMEALEKQGEPADAAQSFWYRHVCALRPQPMCLAEAYSQGAAVGADWRGFGALRGWEWRRGSSASCGRWQLRGQGALSTWGWSPAEVLAAYKRGAAEIPLLNLRGEHDFVTEQCVSAWRVIAEMEGSRLYFEQIVPGCGHHGHLESPDAFAAQLRLWLLSVEEWRANGRCWADELRDRAGQPVTAQDESSRLRALGQEEARGQLLDWASAYSWDSVKEKDDRPGWRFKGQGIPHSEATVPSRVIRRLANWAWGLPPSPTGAWSPVPKKSKIALGVTAAASKEGTGQLQAIVCVEDLQVVGVAAAPGLTTSAFESPLRWIEESLSK